MRISAWRPLFLPDAEVGQNAPIELRAPGDRGRAACRMAGELGWAKTYDAEYVALACLLARPLMSLDARLKRRTARLDFVIGPTEL